MIVQIVCSTIPEVVYNLVSLESLLVSEAIHTWFFRKGSRKKSLASSLDSRRGWDDLLPKSRFDVKNGFFKAGEKIAIISLFKVGDAFTKLIMETMHTKFIETKKGIQNQFTRERL